MGDGRYYTLNQFSTLVFLTLMMIGICFSGVLCVYQGFKQEGRRICMGHVFLGSAGLLCFIEEVIVTTELGYPAKLGELIFLIFTQLLILNQVFRLSRIPPDLYQGLCLGTAVLLGLGLIVQDWLIQVYSLGRIELGWICLAMGGSWILFSAWAGFRGTGNWRIHIFQTLPLLILMQIFFYFPKYEDAALLTLYPTFLLGLNLFSADLKVYRIGDQIFSNINNLIQDIVLVCDPENNIVFRNQNAKEARILNARGDTVRGGSPETLISEDMIQTHRYNIQVFTNPGKDQYLDCHSKTIHQGRKQIGRIFIFSDISEHIRMLDLQAAQKKEFEEVNQKLAHYSNIVFDLEKGKEISTLLNDIAETQEAFMESFKQKVQALSRYQVVNPDGNTRDFSAEVDATLEQAKLNLRHVRNTVAKYRSYYGPEN